MRFRVLAGAGEQADGRAFEHSRQEIGDPTIRRP